MLATGNVAAAALDPGLDSGALGEANALIEASPLGSAAPLDAGADAPELKAADPSADDGGVAVDLAAVQPARNTADATTVPAATTAKRGTRAARAASGRRLVAVS
jgi:hypothetical protein